MNLNQINMLILKGACILQSAYDANNRHLWEMIDHSLKMNNPLETNTKLQA